MMSNSDDYLAGWKEIAQHFKVSVRTVQGWERTLELPVKRLGQGKKPVVSARQNELDSWAAQRSETRSRFRLRPLFAGLAILAVGMGLVFGILRFRTPSGPTRATLTWSDLLVVDDQGTPWKRFPLSPDHRNKMEAGDPGRGTIYKLWNLDGDPANEFLFVEPRIDVEDTERLVCLDDDKEELWEYRFGQSLNRGERHFPPRYDGHIIDVIALGNRPAILAMGTHDPYYPSEVVLLNGKSGEVVDRWRHPGHFYWARLTEPNPSGSRRLILAGVNNPEDGLGRAVLALLPVPFENVLPLKADFFGHPYEKKVDYIVFPLADVYTTAEWRPAPWRLAVFEGGEIEVRARAGGFGDVIYILSRNLDKVEARISDDLKSSHKRFYLEGKLDHPEFSEEEKARLGCVLLLDYTPDGNHPMLNRWFERECTTPGVKISDEDFR